MEYNSTTNRPLVRIGSLQFERAITFTANTNATVYNMSGDAIGKCEKGKTYQVEVGQSTPAKTKPVIRLAISYSQEESENLVLAWEGRGLQTGILRVGENVQVGENRFMDNREYWILAEGFSSVEEAEQVRKELKDFGSYQVLQILETPASGTVVFEGKEIEEGIRCVADEPLKRALTLHNVRVGIGFHWDHRESQDMENILEFQIDKKGLLTAINVLDIEHYLASVNSSEMVPECSLEFLKAQTVVARCTVLATAGKHHYGDPFDLCADDHCQCFHGSGAVQEKSRQAAVETAGEVLIYDNRVCDTRYAKVCGGIGEAYQHVWDNRKIHYLDTFFDGPAKSEPVRTVEDEEDFRRFLTANPDVFCNPNLHPVPKYLDYAHNYFRWQVAYSSDELGKIVEEKSGLPLGPIRDIIPLKRGYSGRLIYVKLIGDQGEAVIGKELEIRRVLSPSHLYSSCFIVHKKTDSTNKTTDILLEGAGWGHGVGLCQVGAAIMGEEGYSYEQILHHYYHDTQLTKLY